VFTKLRPALRRSHYYHPNHPTSPQPSQYLLAVLGHHHSTHVSPASETRAAMSTAGVNGDKGMAASKQQSRSSSSGKALDGARKPAPSPVDGQNNK